MDKLQIISRYETRAAITGQCDCNCDCACMDQLVPYTVTAGQCDCACLSDLTYDERVAPHMDCDCACASELASASQLTSVKAMAGQCDCNCDCACADELASSQARPRTRELSYARAMAGQCDCNCDCACLNELTGPAHIYPTAAQAAGVADQCDCDCDCACLDELARPPETRLASNQPAMGTNVIWQRPNAVYSAPLLTPPSLGAGDQAYTLAFNPRAGQLPAVLNPAAATLWARFARPTRLAAAVQDSDMDPAEAQRALAHLAALHLIEPVSASSERLCAADPTTLAAWLHVTNACNLRCAYCYLGKTSEVMEAETGRLAIEAIFRSALANGLQAVKLKYAGGEPTLNFGRVLAMHRQAQALASKYGLTLDGVVLSNGVALSERMLETMQAHGLRLMISLDGLGEVHDMQRVFPNGQGCFAWVERGIQRAQACGLTPDISVVVSDRNAAGLAELVAWLLERDLPFGLNFYRENDCSASYQDLQLSEQHLIAAMRAAYQVIADNLPRRSLLASVLDRANLAAPHQHTCGVGRNYLVIDHRGQVSKCQMAMSQPVTDVRASDPLLEVRADQKGLQNLTVEDKEGCRDCAWQHWCTGSCPLYTYRATGRYDVRSPNCGIYQALFPDVLRLEGLRLLKYAGG